MITQYGRGRSQYNYPIEYSEFEKNKLFGRIGAVENEDLLFELGTKEISRISEYISLDSSIKETAKSILRKTITSELTYNNSVALLSATGMYVACRTNRYPLRASEIWGAGTISENKYLPPRLRLCRANREAVSTFGRAKYSPPADTGKELRTLYKKMNNSEHFNVEKIQFTVKDFLERYVALLDLDSSLVEAGLACKQRNKDKLANKPSGFAAAVALWFISDNLSIDAELTDICLISEYNMNVLSENKNELE